LHGQILSESAGFRKPAPAMATGVSAWEDVDLRMFLSPEPVAEMRILKLKRSLCNTLNSIFQAVPEPFPYGLVPYLYTA
jgi:hypothetical protein